MRCTYSQPGTFGHECGREATLAASRASSLTTSGTYWALRCAKCAALTGPDNRGLFGFLPLDPAVHTNNYR